jgi:acyl carrier protein
MNKDTRGFTNDDVLEEILISVWEQILDVPDIGPHDHFLDLGGDSIRAIRLVNLLQEESGQVLQPIALFRAPTVSQLAEYLKTHNPECVDGLLRKRRSRAQRDSTNND